MMSGLSLGWLEPPTMNLPSLGKRFASNSEVIYALGSDPELSQLISLYEPREFTSGNSTSGG